MQNGYVTPERTTLVASTHRIYATVEKMAMGDGRYDADRLHKAAAALAKRPVLFDMAALAAQSGTVINAVLFGALAGSRRAAAVARGVRGRDPRARQGRRGVACAASPRAGRMPPARRRKPSAPRPSTGRDAPPSACGPYSRPRRIASSTRRSRGWRTTRTRRTPISISIAWSRSSRPSAKRAAAPAAGASPPRPAGTSRCGCATRT